MGLAFCGDVQMESQSIERGGTHWGQEIPFDMTDSSGERRKGKSEWGERKHPKGSLGGKVK